jgi:hypothetical protein
MFYLSLGTLTDVYIQLDGYAEAGYQSTDLSGAANDFQFTGDVTVTLANPLDFGRDDSGVIGRTSLGSGVWNLQQPNLPTSGSISWDFHANGGAQTGVSSRYIGSATLYYGCTPLPALPEPGTYCLLLSGLGAFGAPAMRRR